MSSRTKPSANRAAAALRLAAHGLHRSDSALGAFLRRKKAHLGAPKAITATAHKLARLIYSMLRYGQDYVDALHNSEHPNWATSWCPCQMLRACPPTRRPSTEKTC